MKGSLATIFLALTLQVHAAQPPSTCKVGAVKQGSVVVGGNGCDEISGSCADYDYDLSFDYLATVLPGYIPVGGSVRIKGDGKPIASSHEDVKFYTEVQGYVGTDRSNSEGNAYLNHVVAPTTASRGARWVWAVREDKGMCSKKRAYVQNRPALNVSASKPNGTGAAGSFVRMVASAYIDGYSELGRQGQEGALDWYYRPSTAVGWQLIGQDTVTIARNFYGGVAYFKVILFDGNYSDTEEFHVVIADVPDDAGPCESKPWLPMCEGQP